MAFSNKIFYKVLLKIFNFSKETKRKAKIEVDKEMGLTLYLNEPVGSIRIQSIRIGFADFAAKYVRLKQLIAYLKKHPDFQHFISIDLNNTSRVVASPLPAETIKMDNEEV